MHRGEPGARADLLWALRGGGEAPASSRSSRSDWWTSRSLYAGSLVFAEDDIAAVFRGWLEWTRTAHPRVTTSAAIVRFPPMRGPRQFGEADPSPRFAYPGAASEGKRLAAPLRALGPAGERPPRDAADGHRPIHGDPTEPAPTWFTGAMLARIDDELATRVLAEVGRVTSRSVLDGGDPAPRGADLRDVPEGSAVGVAAALHAPHSSRCARACSASFPAPRDGSTQAIGPWSRRRRTSTSLASPRARGGSPPLVARDHRPAGRHPAAHDAACWSKAARGPIRSTAKRLSGREPDPPRRRPSGEGEDTKNGACSGDTSFVASRNARAVARRSKRWCSLSSPLQSRGKLPVRTPGSCSW
jgi:hypothetical protein